MIKRRRVLLECLVVGTTFLCSSVAKANFSEHMKVCTTEETKVVTKALADAKAGLLKAIDGMKSPSKDDLKRLEKWFGPLASDTAKNIQKVYETSLGQAAFAQFWCPLSNDLDFKWDVGDLAAVHKNAPGAIFLTPSFFKLPTTGEDTQMGTFIHELTHLAGVGLRPEIYGTTKAKALALKESTKARNNSDNYQYNVEDLIFTLP